MVSGSLGFSSVYAVSQCPGGVLRALHGPRLQPGSQRAASTGEGRGVMETGCAEAEGLQALARHRGPEVFSTPVSYVRGQFVFSNRQFPNPQRITTTSCCLRMKAVHVCKANFGTLPSTQ